MARIDDLRYSSDHLWLHREGDRATVGVTEKVSRVLTWVHSVTLPNAGTHLSTDDEFVVIDSQKAEITIPAPAALEVVAVNAALAADPMLVRMDPRGDGWLASVTLGEGAWRGLLEPAAYQKLLATA